MRRTDSERGWGQELELLATPPPPAVQLSSLIRLGLEAPAGVDTAAGTELAPEPVPEPALEPAAATRPLLMIAGPGVAALLPPPLPPTRALSIC